MDSSVEKLTSISADVTQLLAVHENRVTFNERLHVQLENKVEKNKEFLDDAISKIYNKMDLIRDEIGESKNEVLKKIEESDKKIGSLEKWMWTCLGGGAVIILFFERILPLLTS